MNILIIFISYIFAIIDTLDIFMLYFDVICYNRLDVSGILDNFDAMLSLLPLIFFTALKYFYS